MIFPFSDAEDGMMQITFIVDGPAVPKQRPRIHGRQAYTPKKTRDYEERVRRAFCSSYDGDLPVFSKDTPVSAYIEVIQAIPKSWSNSKHLKAVNGEIAPVTRNGDLDNIAKSILDALNGYAYEDDSQVTRLYIGKRYGADPYAFIVLKEDIRE